VTWAEAHELWRRVDGSIFLGVAVYLYITRRTAERRLQRSLAVAQSQRALIVALTAWARTKGYIFQYGESPETDEPERLH
jgi:hypothetical protein